MISSPLHLYLIRHGETEWALTSRHTGRTDIALTQNGEDEARKLGRHLRDIQFAHVLTSPLKRARRTCELVGLEGIPEIEPDLSEWNYGDYEGRRSVDIRKEEPNWNVFRDGCPHGEMPAEVSGRADRLIARLRTMDGKIALFSHGQFGAVLATRWIGLPLAEARHFPLATASLSILAFNPDHPEVPVIALWNAASCDLFKEVSPDTSKNKRTPIMLIKFSTDKTVTEVAKALEIAVPANHFGIMQIHDLKETMTKKGVDFTRQCKVFEVCQPQQAKKVLEQNMSISTALPCRISVYEEDGKTVLATLKPTTLLAMFNAPQLAGTAQEVETAIVKIMQDAISG